MDKSISTRKATPRPLSRIARREKPLSSSQLAAVDDAMRRHQSRMKSETPGSSDSGAAFQPQGSSGQWPDTAASEFVSDESAAKTKAAKRKRSRRQEAQSAAETDSEHKRESFSESENRLPLVKARCRDCRHTIYYKTSSTFTVECSECGGEIAVKPPSVSARTKVLLAVVAFCAVSAVAAAAVASF